MNKLQLELFQFMDPLCSLPFGEEGSGCGFNMILENFLLLVLLYSMMLCSFKLLFFFHWKLIIYLIKDDSNSSRRLGYVLERKITTKHT